MIGFFTGGTLSIVTAEGGAGFSGYLDGNYGRKNRSPLGVVGLGSEMTGLYFVNGNIRLEISGDQTATTTGHFLDIDGTAYAVSVATVNYASGIDVTRFDWSDANPFSDGENYIIGFRS